MPANPSSKLKPGASSLIEIPWPICLALGLASAAIWGAAQVVQIQTTMAALVQNPSLFFLGGSSFSLLTPFIALHQLFAGGLDSRHGLNWVCAWGIQLAMIIYTAGYAYAMRRAAAQSGLSGVEFNELAEVMLRRQRLLTAIMIVMMLYDIGSDMWISWQFGLTNSIIYAVIMFAFGYGFGTLALVFLRSTWNSTIKKD